VPSPYIATNHSPLPAVVMAIAAVALISGCSLLVDAGRDQCSSTADCTSLGLTGTCERGLCVAPAMMSMTMPPPPEKDAGTDSGVMMPPDESCTLTSDCDDDKSCFKKQCEPTREVLDFLCETPKPIMSSEIITFEMAVREFVSEMPPKGLKALACGGTDATCMNPVASFEDPDGMAVIKLDLKQGFDGFIRVTSDETLPALWYVTVPLNKDHVAKPLAAVSPGTLDVLVGLTGYPLDTSKGLVIMEAFGCDGKAAGGVHFEEERRSARPFYIINERPNIAATVTVRDDVADLAPGGFINATPGFTVFTARIGVDGPVLNEYNVNVQAGTVTYLDIYP
jgi:hypothetical protein